MACKGNGYKTVKVRVRGGIYFYPAKSSTTVPGKQQIRSTSDYTQQIKVNDEAVTYYTPRSGSAGHGTGFWFGTSTGMITSPQQSGVGVKSSQTWKKL